MRLGGGRGCCLAALLSRFSFLFNLLSFGLSNLEGAAKLLPPSVPVAGELLPSVDIIVKRLWWWLFSRLRGFWENVRPFIPRLRFFFSPFFSEVEISSRALIPLYMPQVHSGSAIACMSCFKTSSKRRRWRPVEFVLLCQRPAGRIECRWVTVF